VQLPFTSTIAPPQTIYAVVSTNFPQFTLFLGGREQGPYNLPAYEEAGSMARRVSLTPIAVVGDVIVLATFVSGIGFLIWWAGGGGSIGL